MTLVLAGLSIRADRDRAGMSSVVRVLGLKGTCYRRPQHPELGTV
jgi:hypothetical protein